MDVTAIKLRIVELYNCIYFCGIYIFVNIVVKFFCFIYADVAIYCKQVLSFVIASVKQNVANLR